MFHRLMLLSDGKVGGGMRVGKGEGRRREGGRKKREERGKGNKREEEGRKLCDISLNLFKKNCDQSHCSTYWIDQSGCLPRRAREGI